MIPIRTSLRPPGILLIAAMLLWLYFPTLRWLVMVWQTDEYFAHGPFLPLVSGYLIWLQRDSIMRARDWSEGPRPMPGESEEQQGSERASEGDNRSSQFLILIAGLGLYLVGKLLDLNGIGAVSMFVTLLGLARALWGPGVERLVRFSLLYPLLAVPNALPYGPVPNFLQIHSAACSCVVLGLLGIPVDRHGVSLYTSHYNFVVAAPCSGLKISVTLLALAVLAAHLMPDLRPMQRWLLGALGVPFALAANSLRIVLIVLIGHFWGSKAADGFLHQLSGLFVFAAAGAMLGACGWWMRSRSGRLIVENGAHVNPPFLPTPSSGTLLSARFSLLHVRVASMILLTWSLGRWALMPAAGTGSGAPVVTLPKQLGAWSGKPLPVDPEVYHTLHCEAAVQKSYSLQQPGAGKVAVDVMVMYSRDQKSFHSPAYCLHSGGWWVSGDHQVEVRRGGEVVQLQVVTAERDEVKTQQAYFYENTDEPATGWLPALAQVVQARALHRTVGVYKVQMAYGPKAVGPDGRFTPEMQALVLDVAQEVRKEKGRS